MDWPLPLPTLPRDTARLALRQYSALSPMRQVAAMRRRRWESGQRAIGVAMPDDGCPGLMWGGAPWDFGAGTGWVSGTAGRMEETDSTVSTMSAVTSSVTPAAPSAPRHRRGAGAAGSPLAAVGAVAT